MINRVIFLLRILAALFWFTVATSICIILCLFLIPMPAKRSSINGFYARLFSLPISRVFGWTLTLKGHEVLERAHHPFVVIANHQSYFDIVTYGPVFPWNVVAIGKKELKWMPFFGILFACGQNIFIDRKRHKSAARSLKKAEDAMIQKGLSVWIFPEGTRNYGRRHLLPFKRGAFHLAVATQRPLIALVHPPLFQYFDSKTWKTYPGPLSIQVLGPYDTLGLTEADEPALLQKIQSDMARVYDEKVSSCLRERTCV